MAKLEPVEGNPERQPKESKKTSSVKLPPTDKHLSLEQFLSYWNSVYTDHPKRLIAYLYRRFPIIIKPDPHYIEIYEKPVTRDELLGVWGAGEYEIKLNDKDQRGAVCSAIFEFAEPWDKNPPNVKQSELDLSHRRNQSYIQWRESRGMNPQQSTSGTSDVAVKEMSAVLREVLQDARAARQSNNKDGVESAYAKISEMFTSANKTVLEMVLGQFKQNSPADFLQLLTAFKEFAAPQGAQPLEMLKLIREFFPQQQGKQGDDVFTKFILDQLSEERKANRELMTKLLERKEESGDALAQIEKIGGVISAVRELGGESSGGGGGRSGKWGWLQDAAIAAVSPGSPFSQFAAPVGMWVASKMAGQRPTQPGAPPPPGAPPVQPPPPGLPGAPPPPNANPAGPAVDPQEQFRMDNLMNTFAVISGPLMTFLKQGRSGDELADYLIEGGMLDALQLKQIRDIGRDQIMTMLRGNQMAWQFIGPIEAQFVPFLDEFLAWQPEASEEPAA